MPATAGDMAVHEMKPYTAWYEDHSLTHRSGVVVGSGGSATGNGNPLYQSQLCYPVGPARPQEKQAQGK